MSHAFRIVKARNGCNGTDFVDCTCLALSTSENSPTNKRPCRRSLIDSTMKMEIESQQNGYGQFYSSVLSTFLIASLDNVLLVFTSRHA